MTWLLAELDVYTCAICLITQSATWSPLNIISFEIYKRLICFSQISVSSILLVKAEWSSKPRNNVTFNHFAMIKKKARFQGDFFQVATETEILRNQQNVILEENFLLI